MGNFALAYDNIIDRDETLIACATELPSTRANDFLRKGAYEHVLWRFFSEGSSCDVLIDFGDQVEIDTIAIMGLTGTDPTTQFRFSTGDPTGVDGSAFDSGAVTGRHSRAYLMCPYLRTTPSTGRYLLINASESGVSSIGMGRLFVGLRNEFTYNAAPGWSVTPIGRSVREEGDGGQTFVDRKTPGYRVAEFTLDWLHEDDRNGFVEEIDNIHALTDGHLDMLWMKDTASTHPRDFIWGYQDGDHPVAEPYSTGDLYQASYRIRQRL